jgi:SAM-dependent methyltransferase
MSAAMESQERAIRKSNGRTIRVPTDRDLALWEQVRIGHQNHLYTGLTGRFQIAGHRVIGRWAREYIDKVVLEVGCGQGHHLRYADNAYRCYVGLDILPDRVRVAGERFAAAMALNGDAYSLPLRSHSVDCVLSIYNLEHLRQITRGLAEIRRVLKPNGELLVGLPAEGGLLYGLGRRLTSKRYVERNYGIDYDAIVHWEHWNSCQEVVAALKGQFAVSHTQYLPFGFPSVHSSIIVALRASPIPSA